MSISKTERTFVDVARQLFAKNGLEGTTMNDIAVASGKGRRTLYRGVLLIHKFECKPFRKSRSFGISRPS